MKSIFLTTEYEKIVQIWEKSVKATHDFLNEDDILEIKSDVIKYLPDLKVYAYKDNGETAGFIAVLKNRIEMLFVSPEYFGNGIGGALVDFAFKKGVDEVDVNEQNGKAKGFYEHMGFKVVARFEKDAEGRAFPILRMRAHNNF
ncbi:MAG: GNAT family N-acetyltransferase [Campylobacteraceae bacterium]|jgi:putative acetyltransferase|nr:GNAT family N-acetyltransferase [Campylobacteraceae bacterium]